MLDRILASQLLTEVPDRLTDVTSWHTHTPFAFWSVEALRPGVIVELGTHRGDSYSAFCQAVDRLHLPTRCYAVDTWCGDEHAGEYADDVFQDLSAYHDARFSGFSRLVRSTFDEACGHFADGSIDLLHIDGLHTYDAVRHDFETWAPRLSRAGVVLVHDVNVRERAFGVWRFWEELSARHATFTFHHGHGLGVLVWGADAPPVARRLVESTGEERVEIQGLFARLGQAVLATGRARRLELERARMDERLAELREQLAHEVTRRSAAEARCERAERLARSQAEQLEASGTVLARVREQLRERERELQVRDLEFERWGSRTFHRLRQTLSDAAGRAQDAMQVLALLVYSAFTLQLRAGLRRRADMRAIRRSQVFDASHYRSQLSGRRRGVRNPIWHYVRRGATEGLDPNPFFSTRWYLQQNPEVSASGENPLAHYVRVGAREGRSTCAHFDTAGYVARYGEVARSGLNPLAHYLRVGAARGLVAAPPGPGA